MRRARLQGRVSDAKFLMLDGILSLPSRIKTPFCCRLDTSWTEIFKTNNMSSCKMLPLNLVVRLGNYSRRNLLLDEKGEMEDICDGFLASPGVYHLKRDN